MNQLAASRTALRRARLALAVALGLVSLTGCNEIGFLTEAPNVRGITIPVPPPSFTAQPEQRVDVDGSLDTGIMQDGTRVEIFEQVSGRGYYSFASEGMWVVPDVLVDATDNCLVVSSRDPEGEQSTRRNVKVVLAEGEACEMSCTEPDALGACLCFENWPSGC